MTTTMTKAARAIVPLGIAAATMGSVLPAGADVWVNGMKDPYEVKSGSSDKVAGQLNYGGSMANGYSWDTHLTVEASYWGWKTVGGTKKFYDWAQTGTYQKTGTGCYNPNGTANYKTHGHVSFITTGTVKVEASGGGYSGSTSFPAGVAVNRQYDGNTVNHWCN